MEINEEKRNLYLNAEFRIRIRIRMFLPGSDQDPPKFADPDPGQKIPNIE